MAELSLEQQKALALAQARLRLQEADPNAKYKAMQQPEAVDPTAGMSGTQKFLAGTGKAFTDIARGAGQLVGAVSPEDVKESRALDRPLMQTGAGQAGHFTGNVAALAPTAFIPGVNTYAGAAALGAATGALQPAESTAERLTNVGTGAVISPAALGAARGLVRTGLGLKAGVDPLTDKGQGKIIGDLLRRSAGENTDDAIRNLQQARPLIPGSEPTAGQVAQSGGIAALERAASQADPEAYAQRGVSQNMARIAALRSIGRSEGDLQAAKAAREAAAGPLYKAAREQGVDAEAAQMLRPQIKNLLERAPGAGMHGTVISKAKELARLNGEVLDDMGSVRGLHWMKKAVDDLLDTATQTGLGKEMTRGLAQYKSDLLSVIDELSPLYAQGRQAYAAASPPINRMEIGQALLDKLEPALTQGQIPVRMNAEMYARALREGDTLAQKVTGFSGAKIADIMTPDQMATLTALREDLARSATAANLGRGVGSNTFQNLAQENLMNAAGVSSMPQLLSRPVQMTNYLLRAIYSPANEQMKQRLAQTLLNPQETAQLMQQAAPSPNALAIAAALRNVERYVPAAGALPVIGGSQ